MQNFRSFEDSGEVPLKQINVLIGANNAGKSSVIRALHIVQDGAGGYGADVRSDASQADVVLQFDSTGGVPSGWPTPDPRLTAEIFKSGQENVNIFGSQHVFMARKIPSAEPDHFIVPYLSKRKVYAYTEQINEAQLKQIDTNMTTLTAKLDRISNKNFPAHDFYAKACHEILGFEVTCGASPNGKKPGVYLPDYSFLPLEQMGEGVANLVFFLCTLVVSKNKLFLIEELENDLHPAALKALLDLILESSKDNQFVISTHSNIVVTHLCSHPDSQLLKVTAERGKLPTTSSIAVIPDERAARMEVLRELGYAFSDFDLWEGWLLLEESSAETIIKDYLIPWFAPALKRVRTVSAAGVGNVEPIYKDLHRLVLFTHLESTRKTLTWVRVDGDDAGQQALEKLGKTFSLSGDQIKAFDQPQFENYYPHLFAARAQQVLAITDGKAKKDEKEDLLKQVCGWLDKDAERGKSALEESARTVIEDLKAIVRQFKESAICRKTYGD
ncbi:ATP-binding protein [Curvibacter sp. CHRR-16]|uniref:ATP-dependent nuclease n=1 Tax=Curvibacter sp. CHRR-16 TaxID=2835872 RepID=UPI001BD9ACC3|nr:AAA family ATPase [Curvibacter sp. CHRR-16]MBT0570373.1 ATP-binding protein [Curvibacter sp. CHRR-16]